ncbi:hypothetical protein J4216_06420 [Candidatus Woesearchaeota archaeon]|nr:hypothetical protein [Candidatus Woesearchaeota archaeon]
METTIKLSKNTKSALDSLKTSNETYEDVISNLISEKKRKTLKDDLIEAYKSRGKQDLRILEEWESASANIE